MDGPILSAGALRLHLAPEIGGSITRFEAGGRPIMRPAAAGLSDPLEASCFPLVPFCNRVRDGRFTFRGREVLLPPNMPGQRHPLHGQGWRAAWRVLHADDGHADLAYSHAPGDWPWAYEARLAFALDGEGLTVTLSATNQADEPMPCGLGLHPYFPCDGGTTLDAKVDGVLTVDDEVMPVERQPAAGRYGLRERSICGADLDNGFDGWAGRAAIGWPDRDLRLNIVSAEARWFQVFSPASGGLFVAEPVTHANAALNLPEAEWPQAGLVVLEPGATMALNARFEIIG